MGKIDFNIGEFDTRIVILKQENRRSTTGAVVKEFVKIADAFARVSTKTLDETVGGEQIRVVEVLEVISYLISGINNSCRIEMNGDLYEVISVEDVRRRFMKMIIKKM